MNVLPSAPARPTAPAHGTRLQAVLWGALAIVLAGGWHFLFLRSQTLDLKRQAEIVRTLRQLETLDARWNEAALQVRVLPQARFEPAADSLAAARRALETLARSAPGYRSTTLAQGLAPVREAFARKMELMRRYAGDEARAKGALAAALEAAAQARASAPAAGAATGAVTAALLEFNLVPDAARAAAARAALAALEAAALPEPAREAAARLAAHGDVFLSDRPLLERKFEQLTLAPSGPLAHTLAQALEREFEQSLEQAEVYRTYLISYSGSLLVLVAWLGGRLRRSYLALEAANEGLERKVAERTRELSEALQHLKESETLLIQAEKMSALGQMVAGVAHEINTPLAYVKNSMEAVQERVPRVAELVAELEKLMAMLAAGDAEESALNAQFARASALAADFRELKLMDEMKSLVADGMHGIGQISELVGNLKNFARLDRSKVARFDLHEGLESTLNIARHLVKHKTVKKSYGEIPPVTCSPSQINQVFLNLISNAAHATPEQGGTIFIRTHMKDPEHVAVEVVDNGHGIPEEVLPRIFDPFFTTKEPGKGTGLGLAICYKIVEQHGGKISVTSKPGKGTRFTVILPVHGPVAAQERAA